MRYWWEAYDEIMEECRREHPDNPEAWFLIYAQELELSRELKQRYRNPNIRGRKSAITGLEVTI